MGKMDKINLIVVDSDRTEGEDFTKGVEAATHKDWKLLVKNNNNRNNALTNLIRYVKYAVVPLGLFFKRNKFNSIITWQQFYGLFFAFYCKLFRVKKNNKLFVMTFIYKEKKGLIGRIYRRFFDYVVHSEYIDGFSCVATVECQNYSRIFDLPIEKFHYVQWGLADYAKEYDTTVDESRFVFSAGRSNRDWPFVFEALGNSLYRGKMICAEGNYRGKYDNLEVLVNISDDEYYTQLAKSFCVLISIKDCSISAGQITLIQAMQFGKPVILTQSDGLTNDYVVDGFNGLIVEKDKDAVLNALKRLYEDSVLYSALSENGRKMYEEKFSNFRLGKDIGNIVRNILND